MTPSIVNLLFEAQMLKHLPRTGYAFLGVGRETVAEHSFLTTFVALIMAEMSPGLDRDRLLRMCLVHDLPEARTGDLNYVNKRYCAANEERAIRDAVGPFPFGDGIVELIEEFNAGKSLEARLAKDADQISLLLDLKALMDMGHKTPEKWIPPMLDRLKTDVGRSIAESILATEWDEWWFKNCIDNSGRTR